MGRFYIFTSFISLLTLTSCQEAKVKASTVDSVLAQSAFDPNRCWDEVIEQYNSWQDGCLGFHHPGEECTQSLVKLTSVEKKEYDRWVDAGRPATPCDEHP